MEVFEAQGLKVELAAPTGKAAKRLEQMTGRRAQTIHRLLGYTGEVWQKNGENPIEADVVILDEVSMCDSALMYHLMSAINFNRTKLLLAGDHNQLPPVGPGNVLRDILNLKLIPYTVLDEVVRQAGPLRHNSLEILKGHVLGLRKDDPRTPDWIVLPKHDDPDDALNYLLHLHEAVLKERLGYDLLRDVQVLSPQRSGVLGVENLNVALQAVLQRKLYRRDVPPVPPNRRPPLYPGDKVMQIKNDYGIDVMNGHIGFVVESDPKEKHWVVDFDDRGHVELDEQKIQNVVLAYACTIHKCVTGDTLIPTDHGLTRIRDVASGVADGQSGECSFPVATEAGWGRAVRAFNGGRKPVLRIETRCGFSVTGSHEHPVRVATTDGMEWRLLKDVRPGDSLVLRKGTVYPDTPPLRTPVEAPIDAVNEELGWVLGVLVGDGNYTDTEDGRVEFGKIAPEMVLRYVAAVQTCLGVRTTVRRSSRQNCQFYSTYFHSRSVRAFLRWCGLGHDLSHRKCVPSAILNSPAAVQRAFLQGLFDSDGSVVGNAVILGTTSESLAREVQIMLMAHGMVSTCFMERPESNDGHWHSYWKVGLFGANAVKFGMTVGFSHELKDVRMAVAIHARNDEATKTNVGEIPFGAALASGLRDELRRRGGRNYPEAATVGRFLSAVVAGTRSLNDMNLEIVAKGVSGLGQIGPWGALAQLISDRGLFFDKVTDVSSGEAEVFDIEVPGDHSFIGNGIVCHNSQGSEVPCALCVVHSSHSYMLHRNLFYTAVTRARQRAIILGDAKGIQRAARIHRVDERQTILAATRGGVA